MFDTQPLSNEAIAELFYALKTVVRLLPPEYVAFAKYSNSWVSLFFKLSGATKVWIGGDQYGYTYRNPAALLHIYWLLSAWSNPIEMDKQAFDAFQGVSLCVDQEWLDQSEKVEA